ncbi:MULTISPECIES: Imm51 family immunity protein [Flavobacterium]|uniref:Imm51 family immunity protein n=1 Tax=Flavobacterium TaxID=237 RepID=UPI00131B1E69|nr:MULTISPECIES: Imm51 family immunity protein [unclassified Flavobacterium]
MNEFFPCILVEHEDNFSIICSDFHYFDDYLGDKGGGGYTIERLAKKLAKEHNIQKEIGFDSEAGMFCAYSVNKNSLLKLSNLLQQITGNEKQHLPVENTKPLIPLEDAEKLLLKGFVIDLDKEMQDEFYKNVPYPALSRKQKEYLNAIVNGTSEDKIIASKKINSEARTKIRRWDNYLSHPTTITYFLEAIDREADNKVIQQLIWAVAFICDRHLPDLRTQSYFLKALESKNATTRWLGLLGLGMLYEYPEEIVLKMTKDKSEKVSEEAKSILKWGTIKTRGFAPWMFDEKNYK